VKDSTTALAAHKVSIGVGEAGLQGLRPTICSARAVAKNSYLHMETVYVAKQLPLQASAGAFLSIAPRSGQSRHFIRWLCLRSGPLNARAHKSKERCQQPFDRSFLWHAVRP